MAIFGLGGMANGQVAGTLLVWKASVIWDALKRIIPKHLFLWIILEI